MTLSLRGSKATAAISREGGFPQSIFFIALVVGYFACAQYDVFFVPYRHFVPLPPKEEARFVFCLCVNVEWANSREGGGLRDICSMLYHARFSCAILLFISFNAFRS